MAENTEEAPVPNVTAESELDCFDKEFPSLFYVNDVQSVNNVISTYETKTRSQFASTRETKFYNSKWSLYDDHANHRIHISDREGVSAKLPYDGIPFLVVGKKCLSCTFGPNLRKPKDKDREIKRRVPDRRSNCPAMITIKEVHKFPAYQIHHSDSGRQRSKKTSAIREGLLNKTIVGERRFYVKLPRMGDHKGHDFDKDVVKLRTDSRVVSKIQDLVYRRVFDTEILRQKVAKYVMEELFPAGPAPPPSDLRFYPPCSKIRNILYATKVKMRAEGISVPMPGIGKAKGSRKRKTKPDSSKPKSPKKRKEQKQAGSFESNNAAKMLLMLDKDQRTDDLEPVDVAEPSSSSSSSSEDSDGEGVSQRTEESVVVTQQDTGLEEVLLQEEEVVVGAADNVEIMQDLGELHPDKQACLNTIERMKPLIVFSSEFEKIKQLKYLLESCEEDLKGCFG